jgi:hypothetical protein
MLPDYIYWCRLAKLSQVTEAGRFFTVEGFAAGFLFGAMKGTAQSALAQVRLKPLGKSLNYPKITVGFHGIPGSWTIWQ